MTYDSVAAIAVRDNSKPINHSSIGENGDQKRMTEFDESKLQHKQHNQ